MSPKLSLELEAIDLLKQRSQLQGQVRPLNAQIRILELAVTGIWCEMEKLKATDLQAKVDRIASGTQPKDFS